MVEWLRPLEVRPYGPAALLLKGTSLVELGKLEDAERALLEGRAEAEQLGFDPILLADRDRAERHRGNERRRGASGRAADTRRARSSIGSRQVSTTLDLRSSFLGLPEVQAVIGG